MKTLTRRYGIVIAVLAMLVASCSVDAGAIAAQVRPESAGTAGEPSERIEPGDSGEVAYDAALYCDALEHMMAHAPQDAVAEGGFPEFADAIERTVEFAPEWHRPILVDLADMNRNPADTTADEAFGMFARVGPIYSFVLNDCGIAVPGLDLDEDGSFSMSLDVETQGGSRSTSTGGADSGESDDSISVPTAKLPTAPPTEPGRIVDVSAGPEALAAAVNSSVPAGVDLTFEWQTLAVDRDGDYVVDALVPAGWDVDGSSDQEFDSDAFGFWTELELSKGCQGVCMAQDWAAVMADPELSPFLFYGDEGDYSILVDQALTDAPGRLVVYQFPESSFATVRVTMVRWSNNADRFFQCEAELDADDVELWPAFADACISAAPRWF